MKAKLFAQTGCIVGEGPVWNEAENNFLFIDIRGKFFAKSDLEGNISKYNTNQEIGCLCISNKNDILLALEDGVYFHSEKDTLQPLCSITSIKGRRFNDGKVGPDGRFYLGTTDYNCQGAFYCIDSFGIHELFDGVGCSNGLDWSKDKSTMFYCDTPRQRIEAFDFCGDGRILNRRTVANIDSEYGMPDGLTIDENDNLWIAMWGGAKIICLNTKTGKIEEKIELPVSKPSCCSFVGNNLDKLIITSASFEINKEEEPYAGNIFIANPGIRGRKPYLYKGGKENI